MVTKLTSLPFKINSMMEEDVLEQSLIDEHSSSMNVLLLSAGYGTRLEADLLKSEEYSHLIGTPKALLPIGGVALSTRWMRQLDEHHVYCVVNDKFEDNFKKWAIDFPKLEMVSDQSTTNDNRAGAISCIYLAVTHFNIENNLLIIASDTLLYNDFEIDVFYKKYESLQEEDEDSSLALYSECPDKDVAKTGIIEIDENGKIINFLEKPSLTETTSRKSCPCFYLLSRNAIKQLRIFLEETKNLPMVKRDATGNFIAYLYKRLPIYTMKVKGRFDVGNLESYIFCDKYFRNLKS